MQNVDLNQAKQDLQHLIEKTINGDQIIITRGGQPVVKLVAIRNARKSREFDTAKGLIKIHDDFDKPLDDFQEYM